MREVAEGAVDVLAALHSGSYRDEEILDYRDSGEVVEHYELPCSSEQMLLQGQ